MLRHRFTFFIKMYCPSRKKMKVCVCLLFARALLKRNEQADAKERIPGKGEQDNYYHPSSVRALFSTRSSYFWRPFTRDTWRALQLATIITLQARNNFRLFKMLHRTYVTNTQVWLLELQLKSLDGGRKKWMKSQKFEYIFYNIFYIINQPYIIIFYILMN